MFSRGTPRSNSLRTIWNRKVDLPARRGPMSTVALPGSGVTSIRRGTPVASSASWKSRRMSRRESAMILQGGVAVPAEELETNYSTSSIFQQHLFPLIPR